MGVFGWHFWRGFEPDTLPRKIVVEEIQLWPEGRVCALTDVHLEVQAGRFQPRNVVWFGTTLGFIIYRLHIFGGINNSWCKCFFGSSFWGISTYIEQYMKFGLGKWPLIEEIPGFCFWLEIMNRFWSNLGGVHVLDVILWCRRRWFETLMLSVFLSLVEDFLNIWQIAYFKWLSQLLNHSYDCIIHTGWWFRNPVITTYQPHHPAPSISSGTEVRTWHWAVRRGTLIVTHQAC